VLRVPFKVREEEIGGFEITPDSFERAYVHGRLLKLWQQAVYIVVAPIAL
jgi:hypothetical protein